PEGTPASSPGTKRSGVARRISPAGYIRNLLVANPDIHCAASAHSPQLTSSRIPGRGLRLGSDYGSTESAATRRNRDFAQAFRTFLASGISGHGAAGGTRLP